jgi:hypothetical protein
MFSAALALASSNSASEVEAAAPRQESAPETGSELKPANPFQGIFEALKRCPLIAVGERHMLQEMHDFLTALLFHPELPGKINDIVVEFGNAQYQDVADRFILRNEPVANADLAQIWRHTVGGGVLWDAPVYAQFFRNVRAVNWMQPPERRIRVLLGDPPFDHRKVRSAADKKYVFSVSSQRDPHYAGVVEKEVLSKGRRAILIAGGGHLLRGVRNDRTGQPNAATVLEKDHPGKLFVIDPLMLPPRGTGEDKRTPRELAIAGWPRPSLALLAGTWLAETPGPMAHRAISPAAKRFGAQADAVLYLGPSELLTASRPEPALYLSGEYAEELKRLKQIATQLGVNANLDGRVIAEAGPRFFR